MQCCNVANIVVMLDYIIICLIFHYGNIKVSYFRFIILGLILIFYLNRTTNYQISMLKEREKEASKKKLEKWNGVKHSYNLYEK